MGDIADNLSQVKKKIRAAALRAGRNPDDVQLVAVSKTKPVSAVAEALDAGQTLFGENKVQEGRDKKPVLSSDARWHMIGRLQKNKAKYIPGLFSMVHSVDSIELAEALNRSMEKHVVSGAEGERLDVLVQVNFAGEETKGGAAEEEAHCLVGSVSKLAHLRVRGLMIIPPYSENPEETRVYFKKLKSLRDEIASKNIPNVEMDELSMGMSGDYEVAIEEGATLVRVGSAIFGERDYGSL